LYIPECFKVEDVERLQDAIREIAFGTLITHGKDGLEISHIPMFFRPDPGPLGSLEGHIARSNPQRVHLTQGADAVAIFLGPNTYVTPSWYPSKKQSGRVVPTWNYVAIHAHGSVAPLADPDQLRKHLGELTKWHESSRNPQWAVTDAPEDYIETMMRGIIGIRFTIGRIEGKWKMSQNRSEEDSNGVLQGLATEGGDSRDAVAQVMSKLP
jgi:transcriptional regulator